MGARKHRCVYPLDVTKPGCVVVRLVRSETPAEADERARGLARMVAHVQGSRP